LRRTIRSAREALETDFARQPDWWMHDARAALEAAEREATAYTDAYLDTVVRQVEEVVTEATRELTEVRDELDTLRTSAANGRIPGGEYAAQLEDLRDRQLAAEIALEDAEDRIATVEEIESDKVAYFDSVAERLPKLQKAFPW
jgi:chromosome segregation ATPase